MIVFVNKTHPLCKTDKLLQKYYHHHRVCHQITSAIMVSHRYAGVARNVTGVQFAIPHKNRCIWRPHPSVFLCDPVSATEPFVGFSWNSA